MALTLKKYKQEKREIIPYGDYELAVDRFENVESYLLNIFGDAQTSSISYFKYRKIADKLIKSGVPDISLGKLTEENEDHLTQFNRMRNFQNHIPEAILNKELEQIKNGEIKGELSKNPIIVRSYKHVSIDYFEDFYNTCSSFYTVARSLHQAAKRDYCRCNAAGGEVMALPYDVTHSNEELAKRSKALLALDGEVRIVMEHTGAYYLPVAQTLSEAGLFVSVVHAKLVHDFGNNSIRRGKADKKDSIKIANYALANWTSLLKYCRRDVIRQELKTLNRQLAIYTKYEVALKNNLIALLDGTFPGLNKLFSPETRANGHEKWIDFAARFWHRDCVVSMSRNAFSEVYRKWCRKTGSKRSADKANDIYDHACVQVAVTPKNEASKFIVTQPVAQLNSLLETVDNVQKEMTRLAELLPEYEVVLSMRGVGKVLAPQLIAEIGDVTRFHSKRALTAFAGLDSPPYQSGQLESKERKISKRGSPHLRRSLFRVVSMLMLNQPPDDEVFQFMCKKRAEGKHYYVYMTAAANKFLRCYYGQVRECLLAQSEPGEEGSAPLAA